MITFGSPVFFLLTLVLAAMLVGVILLARWRVRARERFAGPQSRRWPSVASWAGTLLLLAAAALIVVAAARPQWGSVEYEQEVEGIDLVIVLDISQSMTATDVSPSRLGLAQENLATLVESQHGSRIGLVLFAGNAITRSPLTTDTQAMAQLIRRADGEVRLTRGGSDLASALSQAEDILAGSEDRGRAVILVSDGEDHQGGFQEQAAALNQEGVLIFAAGVGTEDGSQLFDINDAGEPVVKVDESGTPVISTLREDTLQSIADAGGGHYMRIGGGNTDLLDLRNDLARIDQAPIGSETLSVPIERFQIFGLLALGLLLLNWLLPARIPLRMPFRLRRRRPRWGIALVMLGLLGGACGGDTLYERNEAANRLFEEGDFESALTGYEDLLVDRPDIDQLSYNAGNTLHRLEAYERAIAETQRALPPVDPALGAATYYSLGNHFLALERLEEAYVAYRNALLIDPNDLDAKHNLEVILRMIQQRDNPPQPDESPAAQGDEPQAPSEGPDEPEAPQPGEGTPSDQGEEAEPGEGSATAEPAPQGTPGNSDAEGQAEALRRSLQEALAGMDEELTYEEAIRILDLLRQQRESQPPVPSDADGPDY